MFLLRAAAAAALLVATVAAPAKKPNILMILIVRRVSCILSARKLPAVLRVPVPRSCSPFGPSSAPPPLLLLLLLLSAAVICRYYTSRLHSTAALASCRRRWPHARTVTGG
jgi:hypothetical protein